MEWIIPAEHLRLDVYVIAVDLLQDLLVVAGSSSKRYADNITYGTMFIVLDDLAASGVWNAMHLPYPIRPLPTLKRLGYLYR